MSQKQIERALKSPDKFQKTALQTLQWIGQNPAYVWGVVGPLLLVGLGWTGWNYWSQHATNGRQEELGTVESVYQDELRVVADKTEALRKQQDELDVKLTKETDAKKKDDLTAQRKVFDAQIASMRPDHTGSLKGYQDFFSKYPDRPEGLAAGMRAAAILVQKKDFAAAKDILQKISDQSHAQKFFQAQSRFMLIGVSEELGDTAGALAQAEKLEAQVDEKQRPQALLAKARLQILLDKKEDAGKTITTLLEKYASSQEADKARSIKALYLGG